MLIDEFCHERMRASREREIRVEVERKKLISDREAVRSADRCVRGPVNGGTTKYSISA